MKSGIDQVIHAAMRKKDDPIKALYLAYDGWFEWMFSKADIKCYTLLELLAYDWRCGHWPDSFNILPKGLSHIPNRIDIDVVISNFRQDQVFKAVHISNMMHVPLILVEHELPNEAAKDNLRKYVNSRMPEKVIHVLPHKMVGEQWCLGDSDREVVEIPYGVAPAGKETKDIDLLVVGDYSSEDYGFLDTMMASHPKAIGIGNNPGMTTMPYSDFNTVLDHLDRAEVCLIGNSPAKPPLPTMMAMAAGATVVTNETRWTKEIITDGETGFLFSQASDIKKVVKKLRDDRALAQKVGMAGRKSILRQFSVDKFKEGWHNLIDEVVTNRIYKR